MNGVYAILDEKGESNLLTRKYFIRRENTWVEEQINNEDIFVNDNKIVNNTESKILFFIGLIIDIN